MLKWKELSEGAYEAEIPARDVYAVEPLESGRYQLRWQGRVLLAGVPAKDCFAEAQRHYAALHAAFSAATQALYTALPKK